MINIQDNRPTVRIASHMGYEEVHCRITSLINMIQAADNEMISKDDIYFTCNMIIDLLPSIEDFMALEKLHKKEL